MVFRSPEGADAGGDADENSRWVPKRRTWKKEGWYWQDRRQWLGSDGVGRLVLVSMRLR